MPERAARLTAPGSALVADLSQKIVAPGDACVVLDASRREAVYDAEDTASLLSFGHHSRLGSSRTSFSLWFSGERGESALGV